MPVSELRAIANALEADDWLAAISLYKGAYRRVRSGMGGVADYFEAGNLGDDGAELFRTADKALTAFALIRDA
jgi:hypothetical protein